MNVLDQRRDAAERSMPSRILRLLIFAILLAIALAAPGSV
jgi:hypothetical protein